MCHTDHFFQPIQVKIARAPAEERNRCHCGCRRRYPSPLLIVPAIPTPHSSSSVIAYAAPALDPLGRIVRAYDRAIRACESFDYAASRESIGLLRAALELDGPVARSFDALYAWCEESIEGHDYVGPARTLRALRDAWCQATAPTAQATPIVTRADWPVS